MNLALRSIYMAITRPSLSIPFLSHLIRAYRAVIWAFSSRLRPSRPYFSITHYLTLLQEGQGYVLAMLGALNTRGVDRFLLYRRALGPQADCRGTSRDSREGPWGFIVLIILTLAISAVSTGVFEITVLLPRLR
jgi:hypothetical protein